MEKSLFYVFTPKTEQDIPGKAIHPMLREQVSFNYYLKVTATTAAAYIPTKIYLNLGETKMATIKRRFKEKLVVAKKMREEVRDPVEFGKSIIEIPENEADRKLSNFKDYKYVSKKP